MTVRVRRGARSRIRERPDGFVVQVQGAADEAAAMAALAAAVGEIAALDGGWRSAPGLAPGDTNGPTYVSDPLPAGGGPFLMIDGGYTPYRLLGSVPDIVARHLEQAGVADAVVAVPDREGPLLDGTLWPPFVLFHKGPAVILSVFPKDFNTARLAPLDPAWLAEAAAWVLGPPGGGGELMAMVVSMQFPLPSGQAAALLEAVNHVQYAGTMLVGGDLDARVRLANCRPGAVPYMCLAAGGPAATAGDLVADFVALREVARRLVGHLGVAVVDFEETFGWAEAGLYRARSMLINQWCLDVEPYQILGPAHLARLGGLPPGGRHLADGRFEVSLGEPADWLPGTATRAAAQAAARQVLGPCLN